MPPAPDPERLAQIFLDLASIPSPSRNERAVADTIAAFLAGLGLQPTEDGTGAQIGGNAGNVICRVHGQGNGPAVALVAHMDTVVPEDEMEPVLEDGVFRNVRPTILGADDKVAVAALLHATELLVGGCEHFPTFELCFTVAEEVGLLGSKNLAAEDLRSRVAVVFDSTGRVGGITVSAPSQHTLKASFRGRAAHAGIEPELGRNAIQAAARAIAAMNLGRLDEDTTANVGIVRGGRATNIVPDLCVVEAECRSRDEKKLAAATAGMIDAFQLGAAQTSVDVEIDVAQDYRAYSLTARSSIVRLTRRALESLGLEPRLHASGGGSDANVLNARGIPTVNLDCGMTQPHTREESVSLADLVDTSRVALALITLAGRAAERE